jgi:UDP-glucose 4-epimerase
MNTLITGANGFLARAVIAQLPVSWNFLALIRPASNCTFSRNCTVYDSIETLVGESPQIDVILHLAACIPSPINSSPADLFTTNVDLVSKLVKTYPSSRHVLASTVSVFGTPTTQPLNLESTPNNPNAYGLSKLAAEHLIKQVPHHAIVRFTSLIGVGMKKGSFIPSMVESARSDGEMRIYGNGERLQNYLDINEAASICIASALNEHSFLSLGVGARSYTNNEVAEMLKKLTGATIIREGVDNSPSFVYELNDSEYINVPHISLEDTLKEMVKQCDL